MSFSVNINDRVTVRLTELGRRIFQKSEEQPAEFFREMMAAKGIDLDSEFVVRTIRMLREGVREPSDQGWIELTLWELMQAFGPEMRMGQFPIFCKNTVVVEVPK